MRLLLEIETQLGAMVLEKLNPLSPWIVTAGNLQRQSRGSKAKAIVVGEELLRMQQTQSEPEVTSGFLF